MRVWRERLPIVVAALWWGSLTALGALVVPLLFQHLETKAMAGRMAAQLFTGQTWLSIACALLLLVISRRNTVFTQAQPAQGAIIFIVLGLLLALVLEFGVAPRIVMRQNLAWWHGLGSAMFLGQWLCAASVLWRLAGEPEQRQAGDRPD